MDEVVKPVSTCYGLSNKCEDGSRVVFLDYDGLSLRDVQRDLNFLTDFFVGRLSNWAIVHSSGNSYHAINFSKVSELLNMEIVTRANVDQRYKDYCIKNDECVLRVSPKYEYGTETVVKEAPVFLEWFPDNQVPFFGKLSRPHLLYYAREVTNFSIPTHYPNHFDSSSKFRVVRYDSGSR